MAQRGYGVRKRAAHFLLIPELASSPPNEALIGGFLEAGLCVDVFAPGGCDVSGYGPRVQSGHAEYGLRWLAKNAWRPGWRAYSVFSGTSEDPLAVVGLLSALHRKPAIALADEIRAGGYHGPRSPRWKKLCRYGMRRAALTIVNDPCRIALQREYAGLRPEKAVIVYPGGYRTPPAPVDRVLQRRAWGVPDHALVIGYSGTCSMAAGIDWLIEGLDKVDAHAVIQPLGVDPLAQFLLRRLSAGGRLHLEEKRLPWREAWAQAAAFDIGVVVYRHQAPQFQLMGISSNRLCMFLAMGVPVIASWQESFRFLEEYDCGVLIRDGADFGDAIERIRKRLPEMRENALRCWRAFVATPERYQDLVAAMKPVLA